MEEKLPQEKENLQNNVEEEEEELVFGYGASAIFLIFLVFVIYISFIR